MDAIVMEGESMTMHPEDFMGMVSKSLECHIEQVWRVKFMDDGTVDMYSFAMPQQKNLPAASRLNNAASLPDWVNERISVLQICESGAVVGGVGQKVSEKVFYVIE
jgi:hypothetical protein